MSSMDEYILAFLNRNHHVLTTEKIHFVHVDEGLPSDDDRDSASGSSDQRREDLKKTLSGKIGEAFPPDTVDHEIHLVEGDPEKEIRRWSSRDGIDLLVLGHKRIDDHEVEVKKLVKKPACSMLLIPERDDYKITKVGMAIDFGELSYQVAKDAENIAKRAGAELIGFHSYQVPSGYHKSGKDHREFAGVMEEHAGKEAEAFLKEAQIGDAKIEYAYDENNKPAHLIVRFVQEKDIDLLVTGSRGRTEVASILMGSIAEEVTQIVRDIPLLIIKEKNENMDLVDALKEV